MTSRQAATVQGARVIDDIDVEANDCGLKLVRALQGVNNVDVLINNAGYFYGPTETISTLNFAEEIKMIDICAIGPLRITSALFNAGLLNTGSKVITPRLL